MTVSTYSVRVTNENGKIVAWIDKDGNLCIEQPNHPNYLYNGENWSTEEDALAWANSECEKLTQLEIDAQAALIAKAEQDALDSAAKQAILDNATKVDEIHQMLTQLLNN
jgi:hypothetical protein